MKRIKQFTSRMLAVMLAGTVAIGSVSVTAFGAEDAGSTVATSEEFSLEEETEESITEPSSAEAVDGEVMSDPSSVEAVNGEAMSEPSSAEEAVEEGVTELPDVTFADTTRIAAGVEAVTSYTVTLDANGGYFVNEWDDSIGDYVEQAEVVVKQIPVAETITAVPMCSEQDGQSMAFAGWSLERDGELVSTEVGEYTPVESCVLYAAWKAKATEKTEEAAWEEVEDVVDEDTAPIDIAQDTEEVDEVGTTVDGEKIPTEDDVFSGSFDSPKTDNEQTLKSDLDAVYEDGNEEEATDTLLDSALAEKDTDSTFIESTDSEEEFVSDEASNSIVESGTCNENITWTLDEKGVLIISGTSKMVGNKVKTDCPWYSFRESIKTVIIEGNVTNIGSFAFNSCINLTSITIPKSVTSIDQGAFEYCESLSSITIPEGVTNIADLAFIGCSSLTNITIPEGVTNIGSWAFSNCSSLTTITLPKAKMAMSTGMFKGCSDLTNIIIPEGVSTLWYDQFKDCTNLKSIIIPKSLTGIASSAFENCNNLTDIYYSGSEDDWASIKIMSLNDPLLNATIHYTQDWKLENGVLTISGDGAMRDYTTDENAPWYDKRDEVKQIVIDDNVNRIGSYTFFNCTNVVKVSIGENVKHIGNRAFFGCGMKEVFIPSSVKNIGVNPFQEASNLQKIEVDSNNTFYTTKAGVLYDKSCKRLISYPQGRDNKFYVVPQGVEVVCDYAFGMWHKLTGIYIPFSVKEIKAGVFFGHTGTDNGLYYYNELSTIYYGAGSGDWSDISISSEGNEALLHDVNIFYDVVDIGVCGEKLIWLFYTNGTLSIIGEGKMNDFLAEEAPWFKYNDRIEQINVEEDVESIGDFAFYDCSTKYVDLSGSVQSIGTQSFGWCQNLVRIWMPDGPVSFGESAFTNCTSLISFDVPGSILKLPDYTFANCTGMEYVNISSTMCEIGNGAFLNCPSLSDVYYSEKQPAWNVLLEKIGNENENLLNAEIHFQESLRIRLEDTWGFGNTITKEKIDIDDYRRFFEDETDEELKQLAAKCDGQEGVCFGMCITAVASYLGYPRPSSYGNYNTLSKVSKRDTSTDTNLSVRNFIVLGQIYQYTNQAIKFTQELSDNTDLDNLYDAIYDYQFNNGSPVIVGVNEKEGQKRAHAVLALGIQSTEKKNQRIRIIIYNPNLPNKKAYMTLKGTPGHFTGWEIENGLFEKFSSTNASPVLNYYANSSDFINKIKSAGIKPISGAKITGLSAKTYTGKAITQAPTVILGSTTLACDKDYTISYKNNTNAGTATVTITGKGNYTGTKTATFKINKAVQSITAKAAETSVSVGKTTTVSITGAKGTKSFKSSDTTIATVTSAGKVTAKKVGTVKITATSQATANYNAASKTVTIKVVPASIAKAAVTCPASKVWAGWALTPVPTVKVGTVTLKKGTDFSLAFKNNKNVGTATITITGKGNYTGTIKKTFKINPKPTSISKITGGSKNFTIGWKKQPSQTSGYQIQYSSRSDFKTQKIVTVSGASKTSRTVSGLAKKHKYYVRIRTYKTVGKTKYYSTWSASKTVTTK